MAVCATVSPTEDGDARCVRGAMHEVKRRRKVRLTTRGTDDADSGRTRSEKLRQPRGNEEVCESLDHTCKEDGPASEPFA